MIIKLTRDGESVVLEGNDDLIEKSLPYAGVWERQVKEVTDKFYGMQRNVTR